MTGSLFLPVNAQTTSEFGYKLHPEKILENTIGDLQVYVTSNKLMVPTTIKNLTVISSNTDIIQIVEVSEDSDSFIKNIKIKALKPGIATIGLAAPGFASKEISIQVYNNNNYPTKIMMKTTPNQFSVDGPKYGFVAVELSTTGGLPTVALEDVTVTIQTPNTDVIKLRDSEITIKQGEYFGITEFDIVGSGDAIIFAETNGMKKISEIISVSEPKGPLQIQLSVIPDTFSSYYSAKGFAILQLVDSEGIPVMAEEDIYLELDVDNPDTSKNTSTDFNEVVFDEKKLVIKKGEYSTFTQFSPRPNLADFTSENEQVFQMFVSVENYLARGDSFTVIHDEIGALEGAGPSITEVLPFLTTGKEEIIGVTYFETDIEVSRRAGTSNNRETVTITVPVTAQKNYELSISSSDSNVVNPINPIMEKGKNAVLVTGNTGTMAPDESIELYIRDNDGIKTVITTPDGPIEDDISLTIESLIPMILVGKEFPLLAYLYESAGEEESVSTTDEDEIDSRLGPTQFVKNGILSFSANEFINIESSNVEKNQDYVLTYPMVEAVGTSSLNGKIGKFSGSMDVTSYTTDPTTIYLGYIDNILITDGNLATVQLLDSVGNPVYAKKDTILELVSNDQTILKTPNQITIKKGEYFNTFELETLKEGTVEMTVLSKDLPLSKYSISIIDLTPVLSLNLEGSMNWNERIEAKLSVSIPEIKTTLSGFQVEWTTEGGEVKTADSVTNSEGIAILNIIANDKETVTVSAKVSGNNLDSATASKTVQILNKPSVIENPETDTVKEESSIGELNFDTTQIGMIIIPIIIVAIFLFLKKTDRLGLITEKMSLENLEISDKIEGIKERISDIKDR
ncbi:MAG: Ig-like domain-containing protein [Nitrosopumilus sp.]|uniref:Ig-like domain-containing protein n=1 Tax=Nitrosopumilus sp. TaxID=2024843 RepID=UPI00247B7259|nr:Ig-like domain-containing protein [Nitrosopumilus sp.]MCV0392267.1 Ig-like domain-containing protein [Nitrosopumilus sp.]